MAEQAAADLAIDAAAHTKVITAARRQHAVRKQHADSAATSEHAPQNNGVSFPTKTQNLAHSVNALGPKGMTPLLVACLQGSVADVRALLQYGADPTVEGDIWDSTQIPRSTETYKEFPLSISAREGHIDIVKMLLAHTLSDVNQASSDTGTTALYLAGSAGKANVAQVLLAQRGVKVNKGMTDGGATPLYIACYFGHANVVKLLLQQGTIHVNKGRTEDGATPLYTACYSGFQDCIRMLLERPDIDVNKSMTDGDTPLYAACFSGDVTTVRLLLQQPNLDVNKARDDDGANPLYIACDKGHIDTIRLLLSDGRANLNHKNLADGLTPLHAAAFNDHLLAAQLLVVNGANMLSLDNEGETPEDLAATEDYASMVEWLEAVVSWSQLRVAAGCRLHDEARVALRLGLIDPDKEGAIETLSCIGYSQMPYKHLPWRNPKPLCKRTIKMVNDATRGWTRTTHWLHHTEFRKVIYAVMIVAGRLEQKDSEPLVDAHGQTRAAVAAADVQNLRLPVLPVEMWMLIMGFFLRSWWDVNTDSADF